MLTARELAHAGVRVTIVEQGELARESSWAGGGILSPLSPWRYSDAVNRLAQWGQAVYPQLALALQEESGIDPEWTPSGMLVLHETEATSVQDWAGRYAMPVQSCDREALQGLEPGLATANEPAWYLASVAQIRNPRLVQALETSLTKLGVRILVSTPVLGLLRSAGRVVGVKTTNRDLTAQTVVVTAGAWSGDLLAKLGPSLPVTPVKGQMLLFKTAPGTIRHIALDGDRYVIPRRDGHVLVGSTLEHCGFDKTTTEAAHANLFEAGSRLFPVLRESQIVRQWAGLRPGSPSGIPYICKYPGYEGLFLNTGHFRNGVILGPASARLVADLVLGRAPALDPIPYGFTTPRE